MVGDGKTNPLGEAIFHLVGDGLQAHVAAFKADGKVIIDDIKEGMATVSVAQDGTATSALSSIAVNYVEDLGTQFGAQKLAVKAIGTSINKLIGQGINEPAPSAATETGGGAALNAAGSYIAALKQQFDSADYSTVTATLSSKINGAFAPKKQEVSPGVTTFTSSFDFTGMAASATQGLSQAFGGQTAVYQAMGDTAAVFIGNGFTDHDFSGAADGAIAQLSAGFANEANTTQLVNIGYTLADTIHNGFTGRIQQQDWLASIISAIVASVMNGLADAMKGSAPGAGTAK
jgi:hypothetical protein